MGTLPSLMPMAFDSSSAQFVFEMAVRGGGGASMVRVEQWARLCHAALLWWRTRIRNASREDIAGLLLNLRPEQCVFSIARIAHLRRDVIYSLPPLGGVLLWTTHPLAANPERRYRVDELTGWIPLFADFAFVNPLLTIAAPGYEEIRYGCCGMNNVTAFPRWDDVVRWALRPRTPPPLEPAPDDSQEPVKKKARHA